MAHNVDYSTASSSAVVKALFGQLEEVRLSRNVSQAALAEEAGVSRSTMTRLAQGKNISVDSLVRIMQALGLADHLEGLLPNPAVRPVDRIRLDGSERRRASGTRKRAREWRWGDEAGDS